MVTKKFILRVLVVNRLFFRKIVFLLIFMILLPSLCKTIYEYFTRDIEVDGWGINVNRNASNYVYPAQDTSFSHFDPNICSQMKPLVVVIVNSDTRNLKRREGIRQTWAKDAHQYNILVLFLVGISPHEDVNRETLEESMKHKDIIVEKVTDVYNNLTIKAIFMLKWVQKKCMQARFLMKADDDTYINLRNLYDYALQIEDHRLKDFLIGNIPGKLIPQRYHFSKWYIPRYLYPKDTFPIYVEGPAYLMSTYVAKKLYFESLRNKMIHFEDVYLTGICAQNLHITAKHEPLFHFHPVRKLVSIQCDSDHPQLIAVSHNVDIFRMHKFHHQLSKC